MMSWRDAVVGWGRSGECRHLEHRESLDPIIGASISTLKHLAITLAGLAVACGGDDAEPQAVPKVDTIAGVVVIRNETGLWRESEQWRIVEEFRVGSLWGGNLDEELGDSRNTSVTLGPNGRIFVAEYTNDRVMVFSGDGEFVRSIGRAGEGPGEFRHPTAMAWDGNDRLWIAEGIRRPYQVFDSTGAYQKSVPRPIRSLPNLQHPLVWESTGTFVEETGDDEQVVYLRVDTLGQPVDTAAVLPLPDLLGSFRNRILLRSWESARFVSRHYLPRMRFSRAPDGTIWSTTNDQLRLVQTGPRGDTIRIAETVHRPAEFDRKDLAVIAEGLAELGIPRREAELVRAGGRRSPCDGRRPRSGRNHRRGWRGSQHLRRIRPGRVLPGHRRSGLQAAPAQRSGTRWRYDHCGESRSPRCAVPRTGDDKAPRIAVLRAKPPESRGGFPRAARARQEWPEEVGPRSGIRAYRWWPTIAGRRIVGTNPGPPPHPTG
ncbi:MAG: 6-bladed beta-propeller, partial [Gemmatimonadetes bacterium]|nr:6-bladed beta-propeller [Gemmatimonadota bacterium]